MRAVPGQPGKIVNPQGSSASDSGHRHRCGMAIFSENQASLPACRLLPWEPEELLQVRKLGVRANCGNGGAPDSALRKWLLTEYRSGK